MKELNQYTDEFKKSVVKEVLSGHISKEEARIHYGCPCLNNVDRFN